MQFIYNITSLANKLKTEFFNLIYPNFCHSCKKIILQDDIFCSNCSQQIKSVTSIFLPLTPTKSIKVFAISAYKDPIKTLILKKAYSDILASKHLGLMIYKYCFNQNQSLKPDFIIPVPLHWTRYSIRGYNQSYEMAKALSKKLNIPVLPILKRSKRTVFQSKLAFKNRQDNVKDVFAIRNRYKNSEILKNKNILLIDDLCTTGATLKNMGKILLKFEPNSIDAVVGARVIKD